MGALEHTGTQFPNGVNVPSSKLFIDGIAVAKTAAQINTLPNIALQPVIAAVATADATTQTASYVQADAQTLTTLANALKVEVNAILTALKTANIISSS